MGGVERGRTRCATGNGRTEDGTECQSVVTASPSRATVAAPQQKLYREPTPRADKVRRRHLTPHLAGWSQEHLCQGWMLWNVFCLLSRHTYGKFRRCREKLCRHASMREGGESSLWLCLSGSLNKRKPGKQRSKGSEHRRGLQWPFPPLPPAKCTSP